MTARKNEGKYEVCQECGANLDYGEACDCEQEEQKQTDKPAERKTV